MQQLNQEAMERFSQHSNMSAEDYSKQLKELIESAGIHLSDMDSYLVLTEAFHLLWKRLDVKISNRVSIEGIEAANIIARPL